MDVDGTITTGTVSLLSQPDGSALEIKTFDAHDGQGFLWPTPPDFAPASSPAAKAPPCAAAPAS